MAIPLMTVKTLCEHGVVDAPINVFLAGSVDVFADIFVNILLDILVALHVIAAVEGCVVVVNDAAIDASVVIAIAMSIVGVDVVVADDDWIDDAVAIAAAIAVVVADIGVDVIVVACSANADGT